MIVVGVFAMRWNVVIGGQIFSKSMRGFRESYAPELFGREGIAMALLIFLTPYIVEDTQKIKDVTLDEANRAELSQDAFTPSEIRQHLDTLELKPAEKRELTVKFTVDFANDVNVTGLE